MFILIAEISKSYVTIGVKKSSITSPDAEKRRLANEKEAASNMSQSNGAVSQIALSSAIVTRNEDGSESYIGSIGCVFGYGSEAPANGIALFPIVEINFSAS